MLIYDVEVLRGPDEVEGGWNNPEAMGFGCAVVYDAWYDVYTLYGTNELNRMQAVLSMDKRVRAGFNNVKFDNRVIFGNDYMAKKLPNGSVIQPEYLESENEFDLLIRVVAAKYHVSTVKEAEDKYGSKEVHDGSCGLNALATNTLKVPGKLSHGAKAPLMIAEGKWAQVFEYCLHDVRLTWMLIQHVNRYGFVIDGQGNKLEISPFPLTTCILPSRLPDLSKILSQG